MKAGMDERSQIKARAGSRGRSFGFHLQGIDEFRSDLPNANDIQRASCRARKLQGDGGATSLGRGTRETLDPICI
jgi:hypothetical protein